MEQLYKDQRTVRRMQEGPFGAYIRAFAQQMIDEGYARTSARYSLQLVADFGRWLTATTGTASHGRTRGLLSEASIRAGPIQIRRCVDFATTAPGAH